MATKLFPYLPGSNDPLLRGERRNPSFTLEQLGARTVDYNADMLIPWILMASYAYYQLSIPLVPDSLYDEWTRRLSRVWWRVKHRHKHLIIHGTPQVSVLLKEDDYPGMTISATHRLLIEYGGHKPYVPTAADKRRARQAETRGKRNLRRAGLVPATDTPDNPKRDARQERRRARRAARKAGLPA